MNTDWSFGIVMGCAVSLILALVFVVVMGAVTGPVKCVEGWKVINPGNGKWAQLIDENGNGVRCTEEP